MNTEANALHVLDEAGRLLSGDRHKIYGDAIHDFRRIGEVWSALLDLALPIPPHTVAAMLAGLKLVRTQIRPDHLDSWVDATAYGALGAGCSGSTTVTDSAL